MNYSVFDKKIFVVLSGSALMNATLSLVMVSLPFLLLSMSISLASLGAIETVGLLTNYAARVPAKIYVERNGSEAGIASGIIAMGVSMSFLYLTRNLALIIAAIFLINVSFTLFHYGIRPKIGHLNSEHSGRFPSSYHLFNAVGPFFALILASLYRGQDIRPVYGAVSIVLLFAGVLSMFLLIFNKPSRNFKGINSRFRELVLKPLRALDEIERIKEKEFLLALTIIQVVTTLSIGTVMVFMPAMAIRDGLGREEIFVMFAVVGLSAFALKYAGRLFRSEFVGKLFFLARPLFLLTTLLILSMGYYPVLFITGYAITAVWYLLEPGSYSFMLSKFQDGDPERMIYLSSLFSRPVALIAPLLGAILWIASPRLTFAVAIFPALVGLLLSHLVVNRPDVFHLRRLQDN